MHVQPDHPPCATPRLRQEAEAAELFKRRAKEANTGLYRDDEEAATAAALAVMPDHSAVFKDLEQVG